MDRNWWNGLCYHGFHLIFFLAIADTILYNQSIRKRERKWIKTIFQSVCKSLATLLPESILDGWFALILRVFRGVSKIWTAYKLSLRMRNWSNVHRDNRLDCCCNRIAWCSSLVYICIREDCQNGRWGQFFDLSAYTTMSYDTILRLSYLSYQNFGIVFAL